MYATGAFLGLLAALSPETEVAAPHYGVNPRSHFDAVAAVNSAGQYLVAYDDRRDDDSGWSNGDNLRLARVASSGALLDLGGIEPSLSGPERQSFAVASDGQDYLVAWSETTDQTEQSDLRILVAGHDGSIMLQPSILRSATMTEHFTPSVCFDGNEYRMVFVGEDRNTFAFTIYAARLNKAGALIGSIATVPTSSGSYARYPQVACASGGSAIVWLESGAASSVRGASWSTAGTIGAPADVSRPGVMALQALALAPGAGGFLAVWDEARNDTTNFALVGQILSAAGARSSANDLALESAAAVQRTPVLGFDGTAWRLLTRETVSTQDQTFVTTIGANGSVTSAGAAITSGPAANRPTSIACASGQCFALWSATSTNLDYIVNATRLGAGNTPLDSPALAVSTPSDEQSQVQLAWDGAQLLVAWVSAIGHNAPQLLARRLDATGSWLDAAPVVVASGLAVAHMSAAALPGGGFALVYGQPNATQTYNTDYSVAFVASNGTVSNVATPILKNSGYYLNAVTCVGAECAVSFDNVTTPAVYRMDHTGALIGTQSIALPCSRPFVVGQERWCVTSPGSDQPGLVIKRFDTTLTQIGTALSIATPNEVLSQGVALLVGASDVTLAWDTTYTDPSTMAISVHMKAAKVDLTAQNILQAPIDLFTSVNNGWLMPQAILDTNNAQWLAWYANDGLSFNYKLRVQELTPGLTLAGSIDELTSCGLDIVGTSALDTTAGNVAFAYLKRDSAPDRGSHRVELRLSTGVPPPLDGGTQEDGGTMDGGVTHGDGGGGHMDGGGANLDGGALDGGGTGPGTNPLGHDSSGCGCDLASRSPVSPALPALLIAVALGFALRRRKS